MSVPSPVFQRTVRQLQLKFTRFYTRFLARRNLTFPQFALVSLLYHEGEAPMNTFAKRLMLSLPAVTYLVDRLEREKFIVRSPHAKDRRVTLLKIKEKGKRAVEQTQGRIQQLFMDTLFEFDVPERPIIQSFYVKFSARLENEIKQEPSTPRKPKKK
jgi:DNA-binding MarR family transcriptional regulator